MNTLRSGSPQFQTADAPVAVPALSVTDVRDMVPHWQKRAAVALSAEAAAIRGNGGRAHFLRQKYHALEAELTPAARDAEMVEVRRRIQSSGLPEPQQFRLMSALSGAAGGFLNPTPMLAEIFILVEKWGVARRYFTPIPMVADTLKLDSLVTEAIAYWVNVGGHITAADLVFGQGTLTVYKLAGISSWSSETNEDAAIALLPIYIASIARAIHKKEDLAGFIGDGSATYGGFTGLLGSAGKVLTLDVGKTSVTDMTPDDWKVLRDQVNIDFRDGAMYFMAPSDVSSVEGMKDLQGRYIYREPSAGLPALLWGFPIADNVGINALIQTDAPGLKFAAFGNPRYMLMGMKREIETVVSMEGILDDGSGAVVYNALQADGAIVRTTERVGFNCILHNGLAVAKTSLT
jgi:HK97 family phage major capsid protein